MITYDELSFIESVDDLGWNVSTSLINYEGDYIESMLEITFLRSFEIGGTEVECSIEDLEFDNVTVVVNSESMHKITHTRTLSFHVRIFLYP